MNTWKNILVVVVAVDRPLDYHVLRTIPFESSNPNCCVTELQGLVDVCKFQPVQVLVWQSRHDFTAFRIANGDPAYWNGASALFLFMAT